jgi:hypothetical protein
MGTKLKHEPIRYVKAALNGHEGYRFRFPEFPGNWFVECLGNGAWEVSHWPSHFVLVRDGFRRRQDAIARARKNLAAIDKKYLKRVLAEADEAVLTPHGTIRRLSGQRSSHQQVILFQPGAGCTVIGNFENVHEARAFVDWFRPLTVANSN